MAQKKDQKKPFKVHVEKQEKYITSVALEISGRPMFIGKQSKEIAEAYYRQKCRELAAFSRPQYEEAKKIYGNVCREMIFLILNTNDYNGRAVAEILVPARVKDKPINTSESEILAIVVQKKFVLRAIPIHFEIREKIRESTEMNVVVLDYGFAEVVL